MSNAYSARDLILAGTTRPISAQAVTAAGGTDLFDTEVDLGELLPKIPHGSRLTLSTKVVTGATAPGSSKTIKVNVYWSDVQITATDAATVLADRKTASSAITLPNSTAATQYALAHDSFQAKARFMYLTVDQDAMESGATLTLDVMLNLIPG